MDEKPSKERDIEMGRRNSKNTSDYGLEDFFEEVCQLRVHRNFDVFLCQSQLFFSHGELLLSSVEIMVLCSEVRCVDPGQGDRDAAGQDVQHSQETSGIRCFQTFQTRYFLVTTHITSPCSGTCTIGS